MAYLEKGDNPKAVQHLKKAVELSPERILLAAVLGHAYGRAGNKAASTRVLRNLESGFHRALVLTGLAQDELAIEQLEHALQERSGQIVYLKVEPIWAGLRAQPRFKKLLRTLQLIERPSKTQMLD